MAKMTGRKQQIYDWLRTVWVMLVSDGMEEETVQEFYSGRGSQYWQIDRESNPWVKYIDEEAGLFREKWRKSLADVTEMFWEVILMYYQESKSAQLPAPSLLPGTPPRSKHRNGHLKQSKDTISLGERLLGNKFKTLRRDIEVQFDIGKVQLEEQILDTIRKSNGPVVKKMDRIEADLEKIRADRDRLAKEKASTKEKVDNISRKAQERISRIKADLSEKTNELKENSGSLEKRDWELKDQEAVLALELGGVEKQHEDEVRSKFTQAKADLETQLQTLLRNLDLQRESEIDTLWADHLPPSIQQSLDRVPKIAQITRELPKDVQKLLAPPQQ